MSRPHTVREPAAPSGGTSNLVENRQACATIHSPTRRRLLALMATLPASDPPITIAAKPATSSGESEPDPIRRLFAGIQVQVAEHEHAFQQCGQLEARLAVEVGYPRVRLPRIIGQPDRYAVDLTTIDETVQPGPRRDRLHRVLRRREERWDEAARICGLSESQEREDITFQAVRDAADALHAVPAPTLTGVRLKLVALLSLEAPGQAFRDASPWRELRLILADLGALSEDRSAGS